MTTDTRIISHKLSLLKLAQSINNISKACRDSYVSRTSFYDYKHRFETYGLSGLEDKPKKAPKMPNETRKDIVEKILEISRRYPSYGASRLAHELDNIVCGATVHNILKKHGLSKKFDRLLAMATIPEDVKLSPVMLRKLDMASTKRIEVSRAGELISVDTFYVGCLKGIGRLYQLTAIDCYSSFGLAHLYTEKSAKNAADFIFRATDIFSNLSIKIENVLTDNGKEFTSHWGSANHIFETCLREKNINHRYTKVRHPWTNGYVERFQYTLLTEFYQRALLEKIYDNLDELQTDLDKYLYFYNFQRTHQGYRLKGKKPFMLLYNPQYRLALCANNI
jgi:transposase InsO family protein